MTFVALLKLGHNNLNVLLAVSGEQEFLVCGSREKRSAASSSIIL